MPAPACPPSPSSSTGADSGAVARAMDDHGIAMRFGDFHSRRLVEHLGEDRERRRPARVDGALQHAGPSGPPDRGAGADRGKGSGMSGLDLVISGGTVVTAADSYAADIGIKDGRIAQIGRGLTRGGGHRRNRPAGPAGRHRCPCPSGPADIGRHRDGRRLRQRHPLGRGGRQHDGPALRACRSRASPCAPASRTITARLTATATPMSPFT